MKEAIRVLKYILFLLLLPEVFCANIPEISVVSVRQQDTFRNWIPDSPSSSFYTKSGDDYTLSTDITGIRIKCTASYPVQWTKINKWNNAVSNIRSRFVGMNKFEREFPENEFNNTASYKYSSTMLFRAIQKEVIGNYSCVASGDTNLQKSVYIYLEEIFPPYLKYSGKSLKVGIDNKDSITLPCTAYTPDVFVYLFKEDTVKNSTISKTVTTRDINGTDNYWTPIPLSDSVSYETKFGFQMKVNDRRGILGRYKCSTDEPGDSLYISVNVIKTSRVKPTMEDRKLEGKAKFFWDKKNSVFYCCSNSLKPPKMIISYCRNSPSCTSNRITMSKIFSVFMQRKRSLKIFYTSGTLTNGSCTAHPFYAASINYVVSCTGDGISVLTELYPVLAPTPFNFNNHTPISRYGYDFASTKQFDIATLWDGGSLNKFIYVEKSPKYRSGFHYSYSIHYERQYSSLSNVTYNGEKIILICHTSRIAFAEGIVWAAKMKNGSLNIIYDSTIEEEASDLEFSAPGMTPDYQMAQVTLSTEMDSVVCFGPVWNTSEWIPAYYNLNVQPSTAPTMEGKQLETLYWTLNDTGMTLHCKANQGEPAPTFSWSKNGEVIADNADDADTNTKDNTTKKLFTVTFSQKDFSTTLKVHLVSHEMHGEFTCSATNVVGTATKIYSIFVTEPHSLALIAGVSLMMVIFLVALISLLVYKMKRQSKSLTNLRANIYSS